MPAILHLNLHREFFAQFAASPSAARRDIVVESAAQKRRSSVGATSLDDAGPDGAKSKSTTAGYKDVAPIGAELQSATAGYKDAAADGAAPKNAVLSRDAIAKIDAVAAAARELRRVRAEALPKMKGLRALYRTLEWIASAETPTALLRCSETPSNVRSVFRRCGVV